MNLLKERAENYTPKEFEKIHSMDAHLVRNLEGYLFSSSGKGRPCTILGNKGTGKTFNLIKTLRRGVRELEDFLPVMFAFKKTGELKPLSTSLLTPGVENNLPELERLSNQEAMTMADAIVFDDFHYVCEAVERGEYPSSKLVEFLEDVLNQAKAGKRVIISSADQLSAYSDVVDDQGFDQIIQKYGFGGDADADALARLDVSSPSLKAWKTIARGLGIEADDVVLRFIHHCDANPRKLVRFVSLFDGKEITRTELQRVAKRRMGSLAEEGKAPFSSKFLVTLFRLGSLPEWFCEEVRKKEEGGLPLNQMLERLEKRRDNIQIIAEKLSKSLAPPELTEVEREKWKNNPVYTVSKKYHEGPLGKKVVKEKLNKLDRIGDVDEDFLTTSSGFRSRARQSLNEEIKSEFLDFVENVERYDEFLQNLKEVKGMVGEHFEYILKNFDILLERMGSEWFPLDPCKIAFHDILYGPPPIEKTFEFPKGYYYSDLPPHERLERGALRFDLPRNLRDDAHEILEQALSRKISRGRSMTGVVISSLYTACRKNSFPISIREFETRTSDIEELEKKVPMKEIYSTYKEMITELGIETSVPGPSLQTVKVARSLELSPKAVERAVDIVEKAREKNLISGKSPRGIAAGAVYLSSVASGERRTQAEVADVANVSEPTLRNQYQELKGELGIST